MNVRRVELDWARDKAREKGVRTVDGSRLCPVCSRDVERGMGASVCVWELVC